MSSNTNNLRAILDQLSDSSASRGWLDCKSGSEDTHPRNDLVQNALAAVLALLPEQRPVDHTALMNGNTQAVAIQSSNDTIDQTRRNLIGEQL